MIVTRSLQRYFYPLIALVWVLIIVSAYWNSQSVDLTALYVAAFAAAQGLPDAIYAVQPDFLGPGPGPAIIESLKGDLGLIGHPTVPYIYPPIWAWLLAPLTEVVSQPVFARAVLILHAVLMAATVGLAWRIVRPPKMSFQAWLFIGFLILFTSTPSHHALYYNQPQITTIFLVALAFERYRSGFFITGGAILAIAAAFKLSPALLALIFLLDRNWRALAGFVVVGALLGLSSIAIAGWPLHQEFLGLLSKINKLVIIQSVNNSFEMILFQFSVLLDGQDAFWDAKQTVTRPEPLWLATLMSLIKLVALASLILMRPRLTPGTAMPVLLLAFLLTGALFGPISWGHYFLLPMLLLPVLFHIMSRRWAWFWIIAILISQSRAVIVTVFEYNMPLYYSAILGALGFLALLVVVQVAVFKAVRFEPEVPLHFR